MGFFSDLKDDLSQAVNELLPEEENVDHNAAALEETLKETLEEAGKVQEDSEEELKVSQDELEAMLADLEKKEAEKAKSAQEEVRPRYTREDTIRSSFAPSGTAKMAADEVAVITQGMVVNGDLVTEGSIELTGCINGNINALGKLNVNGTIIGNSKAAEIYAEGAKITGEVVSEGSAKIGPSSVIIGNIAATSAVIAGAVKGDIDVKGPVILDATAIVMGNIKSKSVQINNGAVIEGMCSQCYADVSPTSFFDEIKKVNKK